MTDTAGETRDITYSLKAGESIRLTARYNVGSYTTSGLYALIRFLTQNDISITYADLDPIKNIDYGVKSWADTRMRRYLNMELIKKFPDEVRAALKMVTKYSATSKEPNPETDFAVTNDLLWIPSKTELNPASSYSDFVISAEPVYDQYFPKSGSASPNREFYRKGLSGNAFLRDLQPGSSSSNFYSACVNSDGTIRDMSQQSVNSSALIMLGFCT